MAQISHVIVVVALVLFGSVAESLKFLQRNQLKNVPGTDEINGWNYRMGGADWGDLLSNWSACSTGKAQSPISIEERVTKDGHRHAAFYYQQRAKLVNDGYSLKVITPDVTSSAPLGYMTFQDSNGIPVRYSVTQFHFHSPSEHTINSEPSDMEMHVVHTRDGGSDMIVVSFLFDAVSAVPEGGEDDSVDLILTDDPRTDARDDPVFLETNAEPDISLAGGFLRTLNWNARLDDKGDETTVLSRPNLEFFRRTVSGPYYYYNGSISTPPCTEGVRRLVFPVVHGIPERQFRTLRDRFISADYASAYGAKKSPRGKSYWQGNQRSPQPLNGRTVFKAPGADELGAVAAKGVWPAECDSVTTAAACVGSRRARDFARCCWWTGGAAKTGQCRVAASPPAGSSLSVTSHWSCQVTVVPTACSAMDKFGRDACVRVRQSGDGGQDCCWWTGGGAPAGGTCGPANSTKTPKPLNSIADPASPATCMDAPLECGHRDRFGKESCSGLRQRDGAACCWFSTGDSGVCRTNTSRPVGSTVDPNSDWSCQDPPATCEERQRYGKDGCTSVTLASGTPCCYLTGPSQASYCLAQGAVRPKGAVMHVESHWKCQDVPATCDSFTRYGKDPCIITSTTSKSQCCWYKNVLGLGGVCSAKTTVKLPNLVVDPDSNHTCQEDPQVCDVRTRYGVQGCVSASQQDGKRCCWYESGNDKQCTIKGSQRSNLLLHSASHYSCRDPPSSCAVLDGMGKEACVNSHQLDGQPCCYYLSSGTPYCRAATAARPMSATVDSASHWTCQDPPSQCSEMDRYKDKDSCIYTFDKSKRRCCFFTGITNDQQTKCTSSSAVPAGYVAHEDNHWSCLAAPIDTCATLDRYATTDGRAACNAFSTVGKKQCCHFVKGSNTACRTKDERPDDYLPNLGIPDICTVPDLVNARFDYPIVTGLVLAGTAPLTVDALANKLFGWTKIGGTVGVSAAASPPVGKQALYLKDAGAVSQTLSGLAARQTYQLSWRQLNSAGSPTLSVSVAIQDKGEVTIYSSTVSTKTWALAQSVPFMAPDTGVVVVKFSISATVAGSAVFFTDVTVLTSAPSMVNNGFEQPAITAAPLWSAFSASVTVPGWTQTGATCSIARVGSNWTDTAPEGSQVLVIGRTGAVSGSVSNLVPGEDYQVQWLAKKSPTAAASYMVLSVNTGTPVDTTVWEGTISSEKWQIMSSNAFTAPSSGNNVVLKVKATNPTTAASTTSSLMDSVTFKLADASCSRLDKNQSGCVAAMDQNNNHCCFLKSTTSTATVCRSERVNPVGFKVDESSHWQCLDLSNKNCNDVDTLEAAACASNTQPDATTGASTQCCVFTNGQENRCRPLALQPIGFQLATVNNFRCLAPTVTVAKECAFYWNDVEGCGKIKTASGKQCCFFAKNQISGCDVKENAPTGFTMDGRNPAVCM